MFRKAQNIAILDSHLILAQRDVNIHNLNNRHGGDTLMSDQKKVLAILHPHISEGAFYDSEARLEQPKCLPGTRAAIIKKIMEWVRNTDGEDVFKWLYGPAGTGKTTLQQTIAELSSQEKLLAACFFFFKNGLFRSDKARLIPTLTYQLVTSIPEMCEYILDALELDPAIFSRTLLAQATVLIVDPLKKLSESGNDRRSELFPLGDWPKLVIIDGLDECGGSKAQQDVINVLCKVGMETDLSFLFASRPEPSIREAFNNQNRTVFSIALDDNYQSNQDIRLFFRSKFSKLRMNSTFRACVLENWPPESVIDELTGKSSGQFIFASTVMKFIESSTWQHPIDSLNIILGLFPSGENLPFAELDALYLHIFASISKSILPKVLDILCYLLLQGQNHPLMDHVTPSHKSYHLMEALFGYRRGEITILLSGLHAILSIPDYSPTNKISILHNSLSDFLLDQSRSAHFYINPSAGHEKLARLWIRLHEKKSTLDSSHIGPCIIEIISECIQAKLTADLTEDLFNFKLTYTILQMYEERYSLRISRTVWSTFFEWLEDQTTDSQPELKRKDKLHQQIFDQFVVWMHHYLDNKTPEFLVHFGALVSMHKLGGFSGSDTMALPYIEMYSDSPIMLRMMGEFFSDSARSGLYFLDENKYTRIAFAYAMNLLGPSPSTGSTDTEIENGRYFTSADVTTSATNLAICLPLSANNSNLAELLEQEGSQFKHSGLTFEKRTELAIVTTNYIQLQKRCKASSHTSLKESARGQKLTDSSRSMSPDSSIIAQIIIVTGCYDFNGRWMGSTFIEQVRDQQCSWLELYTPYKTTMSEMISLESKKWTPQNWPSSQSLVFIHIVPFFNKIPDTESLSSHLKHRYGQFELRGILYHTDFFIKTKDVNDTCSSIYKKLALHDTPQNVFIIINRSPNFRHKVDEKKLLEIRNNLVYGSGMVEVDYDGTTECARSIIEKLFVAAKKSC